MTPRPAPRRGIPLPREHGAWVMLYAPLLTGLVVYNIHPLMCLLLRECGDAQTWWWLGGCGLIVVAGAGVLQLLGHGRVLWLTVPAVALLGWQAIRRRGTRRQIDHSLLNEMLTVPVLGLGAPAAQIVASESVTHHALLP